MQLDLLNYRRQDPATSKEAGDKARNFRSGDHTEIMKVLAAGRAMAAEEISDALRWDDHVRVNRRLAELERAGLVARTSERHTNRSGRSAFRYQASHETSVA